MSRWRIYPLVFAFIGFVCSLTVDASSWKQGTRRHNLLSVITTTTTQPPAPLYPVFESATMTSWNTPSPVEVSCDIYTAGREGWRASDKNYATYWDAEVYNTAPYPHYWQYFLGAGVSNVLVSATITPYQSVAPIVFDVEGSQNGTGWTVLFTNGVADNNLPQMFTNLFPAYYSYYRFNFSNGVADNRCVVREIHLSSARPLPVLTSNTEPSPYVASADMEYATNYCFHAFDGDIGGVQWKS